MGEIYHYKSKCGYEERLYLGCGLKSVKAEYIKKLFPHQADELLKQRDAGVISSVTVKNMPAYCAKCGRIEAVSCLEVTYPSGEKKIFEGRCEECGSNITILDVNKKIKCPRCADILIEKPEGRWD